MLKVFLTGGIGSGKTTISDLFAELGVPVIDTDIISRHVVEPGQPALEEITQCFGSEVLDENNGLNRKKLREIIFIDTQARKDLESILHKRIYDEVDRQLGKLNVPYAIIVVPLLIETDQQQLADRILLVDTTIETQQNRVLQRDNISQTQFDSIITSQASRDDRLKYADDVIVNDTPDQDLSAEVKKLHLKYLQMAKSAIK